MLSCDQAFELISASLDGEITAEEQAQLQAHMATCPSCAQLQEDLTAIHQMTAEMLVEPPATIKANVMAEIIPQANQKVVPFPAKIRRITALAAMVAVVLFGGYSLWSGGNMGQDTAAEVFTTTSSFSSTADGASASMAVQEEKTALAITEDTTATATRITQEQIAIEYLLDALDLDQNYPDAPIWDGDVAIELGQNATSLLYIGIYYTETTDDGTVIFAQYTFPDATYTPGTQLETQYWQVTPDGTASTTT